MECILLWTTSFDAVSKGWDHSSLHLHGKCSILVSLGLGILLELLLSGTVDSQYLRCATEVASGPLGVNTLHTVTVSTRLFPPQQTQTQSYKQGPSAVGQTAWYGMLILACTEDHFSACCTSLNKPAMYDFFIGVSTAPWQFPSSLSILLALPQLSLLISLLSSLSVDSPFQALDHVHQSLHPHPQAFCTSFSQPGMLCLLHIPFLLSQSINPLGNLPKLTPPSPDHCLSPLIFSPLIY